MRAGERAHNLISTDRFFSPPPAAAVRAMRGRGRMDGRGRARAEEWQSKRVTGRQLKQGGKEGGKEGDRSGRRTRRAAR